MKIIDFARKGNVVRFFLGADDLKDWHGDDWNDTPYEHNAGEVYDEFISGHIDIAFAFDKLVLEPCDGAYNSDYCKDDMKARKVPCLIVVPAELAQDSWHDDFAHWVGADGVLKFYFGDRMEEERGTEYGFQEKADA